MDGMVQPMQDFTDGIVGKINAILHPAPDPVTPPVDPGTPAQPEKRVKQMYRSFAFPAQQLQSEAEIDAYVESIRAKLKSAMNGYDIVDLK